MSAGVAPPVGWADLSIRIATWSSHGVLLSLLFAERIAAQLDAMGVVDDAIEDRVGQSWIADQVMPAVHWDLAGDQRGATSVAVLDDLQQVVALLGGERFEPPVVKDEQLYATKRVGNGAYNKVKKILGEAGTVELVGILGYYAMVSMTLNTFKAPLPQGMKAPFKEGK